MENDSQLDRFFSILLVEDSEADVELIKFILRKAKQKINLDTVENGSQALDYLYKRNDFKNKTTPDLILLDLNIPIFNGFEVLQEIKKNEDLRIIPVVILTTSDNPKDILKGYQLYANSYLQKPADLTLFEKLLKTLEEFWFDIAKLPGNGLARK